MDNKIFITLGSQKFQFNRLLKAIDELCEKGTVDAEEFFQDSTRFSYSDLVGKWQPYQIKGTIISVIRNIINPFPFRDALTKAIRLKKVSKFNKNVAKLNNKDEERK